MCISLRGAKYANLKNRSNCRNTSKGKTTVDRNEPGVIQGHRPWIIVEKFNPDFYKTPSGISIHRNRLGIH